MNDAFATELSPNPNPVMPYLTRHLYSEGPRWARDGKLLPPDFTLTALLKLRRADAYARLDAFPVGEAANAALMAPVEASQEVWASGVTYLSSRLAREAESTSKDVYERVYDATRPELFFKANGWRVVGPDAPIRIRSDSAWDVPEPELVLVLNSAGEIMGYTVGNDVSSRSIEGENPLYLPQAKVYNGSAAMGPGLRFSDADAMDDLSISLRIHRRAEVVFSGESRTSQIKRPLRELAEYLFRELDQPGGAFLMTGTGIIPTEAFSLQSGDRVQIAIDGLVLNNVVA